MNDPYWLDVLHKLHFLGLVLAVMGGLGSLVFTVFMVMSFEDNCFDIFKTKKWLFMWIIPFVGVCIMIFCPEINK